MIKRCISAVAILALTGCATVFTGSESNVHMRIIDSENNQLLHNVKCSVTDGDGIVYPLVSNPGNVIVPKGKGTLRVDCRKSGYSQQNMGVSQTINGVTFINILFWPGFIVDGLTGNMHKYPANVTIQMQKNH